MLVDDFERLFLAAVLHQPVNVGKHCLGVAVVGKQLAGERAGFAYPSSLQVGFQEIAHAVGMAGRDRWTF